MCFKTNCVQIHKVTPLL